MEHNNPYYEIYKNGQRFNIEKDPLKKQMLQWDYDNNLIPPLMDTLLAKANANGIRVLSINEFEIMSTDYDYHTYPAAVWDLAKELQIYQYALDVNHAAVELDLFRGITIGKWDTKNGQRIGEADHWTDFPKNS